MPLDPTADCTFTGPALPEPFVKSNLEAELNRLALLPKSTGAEGRALNDHWQFVRCKLRNLVAHGGGLRVQNHVIEPLLAQLGYARIEAVEAIQTREGDENGGALLLTEDGTAKLRVWCVDLEADLDAPARRGLGYAPLWREQLGEAWREAWTAFTPGPCCRAKTPAGPSAPPLTPWWPTPTA